MDEHQQGEVGRGLRQGSREAWLRLYDAYAESVWRIVARLTGADAATVADIVQETFLAAAKSARGFDPQRGSLWAWLWGIARNRVSVHCRRCHVEEQSEHARRWWVSQDGRRRELLADSDPRQALESRELATLVRIALAELPEDYQLLLVAKYLDDASAESIAAEVGMSVAAVYSKLARARRSLQEAFEGVSGTTKGAIEVNL